MEDEKKRWEEEKKNIVRKKKNIVRKKKGIVTLLVPTLTIKEQEISV